MGKSFKRHKGRNSPSFVMLRHDIMDSPAWRSLSATAQALWCHIQKRFNGTNNGEIPLSCREAALFLNVGKGTASKAFEELLDRGFIKVGQHSDFRLKQKRARRWIMTHEGLNGKPPSSEWREYKERTPKHGMPFPDSQKPVDSFSHLSTTKQRTENTALSDS